MYILGIETSCDETASAIVKDGREVITNTVYTQIEKHKKWGGVIPELASRLHLETINEVINKNFTSMTFADIDAIAVTNGPGLVGSLLIGVNAAKTLSWIHQKPIIPVNHLFGHVCSNFIDTDLEPPFLCLLVSGGHTQIIEVKSYKETLILGETIDDAAGEAFDKVARLMGLPYPGGPSLDKLAREADDKEKYRFTIPKVSSYDFSFSGLKTAVLRLKENIVEKYPCQWDENKANIAYAFQNCVAVTLLQKIQLAVEKTGIEKVVLAGGVAANSRIRELFKNNFSEGNLVFPQLKYCTDNAAMIAAAAFFTYDAKVNYSDLGFEVFSR